MEDKEYYIYKEIINDIALSYINKENANELIEKLSLKYNVTLKHNG